MAPEDPTAEDRVRVCVASYNTRDATELCIRSMVRNAGHPFRLTVGDAGSTDGSLEMLERFSAAGWLDLEIEPGRQHADWLDAWLAGTSEGLLVFSDSDIDFLRRGWLQRLVEVQKRTGAGVIAAQMLEEHADYCEPVGGSRVRLAARAAPWLLALSIPVVGTINTSFRFHAEPRPGLHEGVIAFDVGGRFFHDARAAGVRCITMPRTYNTYWYHFAGLSWRGGAGRSAIRWRLMQLYLRGRLGWLRRAAPRSPGRRLR